jgi:hypothetical protein
LGQPNYKPDGHPKPVLWFGSEFSPVGEGVSLISHPNQFCGGSGFCSNRLESDPLPSLPASRSLSRSYVTLDMSCRRRLLSTILAPSTPLPRPWPWSTPPPRPWPQSAPPPSASSSRRHYHATAVDLNLASLRARSCRPHPQALDMASNEGATPPLLHYRCRVNVCKNVNEI